MHNSQFTIHNLGENANSVRSLRRVGAAKLSITQVESFGVANYEL